MMDRYGEGPGLWGYLLTTVSMILFWALIIIAIIALVRYLRHGNQRTPVAQPQQSSPEQLLAERFARGEIDEPEYRHRLEVLRSSGRPAG
jgi:putative membrane protein